MAMSFSEQTTAGSAAKSLFSRLQAGAVDAQMRVARRVGEPEGDLDGMAGASEALRVAERRLLQGPAWPRGARRRRGRERGSPSRARWRRRGQGYTQVRSSMVWLLIVSICKKNRGVSGSNPECICAVDGAPLHGLIALAHGSPDPWGASGLPLAPPRRAPSAAAPRPSPALLHGAQVRSACVVEPAARRVLPCLAGRRRTSGVVFAAMHKAYITATITTREIGSRTIESTSTPNIQLETSAAPDPVSKCTSREKWQNRAVTGCFDETEDIS
uniref:Uncharacterized protein n=1 Tax=Setaria italica TaxID=4555 RepID=K4ADR0_SETIT